MKICFDSEIVRRKWKLRLERQTCARERVKETSLDLGVHFTVN